MLGKVVIGKDWVTPEDDITDDCRPQGGLHINYVMSLLLQLQDGGVMVDVKQLRDVPDGPDLGDVVRNATTVFMVHV